jgi:uncharacterized protein (TIGR02145 family)
VPSDAEWTVLADFLEGESVAGGKMKTTGTVEAGTGLWNAPNTDATNSSGFSSAPSGDRYNDGIFYNIGNVTYWWSSSEIGANLSLGRGLNVLSESISRFEDHTVAGFSVRCLRD